MRVLVGIVVINYFLLLAYIARAPRVFTSTLNGDSRWGFEFSFVQYQVGRSQLLSDTDVGNNPLA